MGVLFNPTIVVGDVTGFFRIFRAEDIRGTHGWLAQAFPHGIEEGADLCAHQDDARDDKDRGQRHDKRVLRRVGAAFVLQHGDQNMTAVRRRHIMIRLRPPEA